MAADGRDPMTVIGGENMAAADEGEKMVTMLCIDGGGIRGLIPATILIELQKQLQEVSKRQTAHISEYFDVITGTSTGGLIATMLTAPKPDATPEPYFRPQAIQKYYLDNGPKIFHRSSWTPPFVLGPKYDGKELRRQLESMLKYKTDNPMKVGETLTNVVIPTYDIYGFKPVIFSSFKVKGDPNMNANLSDICLGTSAAPLYFPPVGFSTISPDHKETRFNLIDGGVIANNPTLMAVNEVAMDRQKANQDIPKIKFMVLSLGTGSSKDYEKFTAEEAAKWGILGWVGMKWPYKQPWTPILDVFFQGSADVVDMSSQNLFKSLGCSENYLRVQIDTLEGPAASLDDTSPENMNNLIDIANHLLDSPVTIIDEGTGRRRVAIQAGPETTYRDRIRELAVKLVGQKGY